MEAKDGGTFRARSLRVIGFIVVALCAVTAKAGWHSYKPSGCVDGQGILKEMMSRCPQYGLSQIRGFDQATQCHEATHFVNGELSSQVGQGYGAFYVGNGRCFILSPAPNVTVGQVAQCVPETARTSTYRTYLTGDRVKRNCLSLVDEFCCYTNDAQCTKELRLQDDGGLKRAQEFSGFMDALVHAVKTHDPSYPGMQKLLEFVKWQKARVAKLIPAKPVERSLAVKAKAATPFKPNTFYLFHNPPARIGNAIHGGDQIIHWSKTDPWFSKFAKAHNFTPIRIRDAILVAETSRAFRPFEKVGIPHYCSSALFIDKAGKVAYWQAAPALPTHPVRLKTDIDNRVGSDMEFELVGATAAADPAPIDLAPEWRELNKSGSCVHISAANSMRWLSMFNMARDYRKRYGGGESPGPHKRKLTEIGAKFAMTTDADEKLLEYAIANRRMVGVTWSPSHCINLVGRENGNAVLLGNSARGIREYHRQPWGEFLKEWRRQSGWAFVILDGIPPPPTPK